MDKFSKQDYSKLSRQLHQIADERDKLLEKNKALVELEAKKHRRLEKLGTKYYVVQTSRDELLVVLDRVIRYVPVASEIVRDCKSVYVKATQQKEKETK